MPRSLKIFIAGVVTLSAIALVVATLLFPADPGIALTFGRNATDLLDATPPSQEEILAGVGFWIMVTLLTSALPVKLPFGSHQAVGLAPIVAAMTLGGPAVAGWVAAIGVTEGRELRGAIPWYGSLANHAGAVLPAVVGGIVRLAVIEIIAPAGAWTMVVHLAATVIGVAAFVGLNVAMAGALLALRTGRSFPAVVHGVFRETASTSFALGLLGWLMSVVYSIQWWATLLFALPLYTTRVASQRLVEMRDMFTQTIGALAEAVDKRDPDTALHSQRVKAIAVDIGRVMRVSDGELEALEWGGLLHDVGKIGVPDAVLLKAERLTREERMIMNSHPVQGAEIIAPVTKLAAELPIIRHHHEWYNGSGYPDRLIGDEIPKLARILHVADAFEAMTAKRPYRKTPLTREEALAELRKFAGVQFDPVVVDAFVKTDWVEGVPDAGRATELRPIPMLHQAAERMTAASRADATSVATTTATATAAVGGPADLH
jgi:putative nucleotidyltransferase with HDIG domain